MEFCTFVFQAWKVMVFNIIVGHGKSVSLKILYMEKNHRTLSFREIIIKEAKLKEKLKKLKGTKKQIFIQ